MATSNWASIIPLNFGDNIQYFMLYDKDLGAGELVSISNNKLLHIQTFAGLRKTWDKIVPYNYSGSLYLYFYDSSAGQANFQSITSTGVLTLKGTASGLKSTYSHIESFQTDKMIFFDSSSKMFNYFNIKGTSLGAVIKSSKFQLFDFALTSTGGFY